MVDRECLKNLNSWTNLTSSRNMTVDFVSEVDRRFFANNLLTNEDWDMTEVGMDNFNDLSEMLEIDSTLSPEHLSELPDELLSLDGACPPLDLSLDAESLPLDNVTFDNTDSNLSDPVFIQEALDECWKESSDSSDSGIYQENCVHIKQEPPSPVSSNCSDAGSEGYGSGSSSNGFVFTPITTVAEDVKPTIIINTTSSTPVFPGVCTGSDSNINSILNSKIKIQPKPSERGNNQTSSKSVSQKLAATNKLVLTGEQFAKLTASGNLRFQPPGEVNRIVPTTKPLAVPTSKPASPSAGFTPMGEGDDKAVRRQQRMIKNRESASLSRKKKKEYLSSLEDRLKDFTSENHKLKQENESLKRKLSLLQMENDKLKKPFPMSPAKRTCLLALVLVFGFNLGPISNLFNSQVASVADTSTGVNVHHGRHLLAVQEQAEISYKSDFESQWNHPREGVLQKLRQLSEEMGWIQSSGNMNQSQFEALMCPTFFNKTESIRLAEQLAGWMIQHEEEKKKSRGSKPHKKKKEINSIKTLKKALRGELKKVENNARTGDKGYPVQVYDGQEGRKDFLDAIHRRNDTFYVLSFNTDYLLVPASAHNKTMRPRMSLVMPIVGLNDTMQPPPGNIGMMQIDCEVISTQLIHVHKSVVPAPSSTSNSTNQQGRRDRKWRDRG